jgi:hypothetical protein
VRIVLAFVPSRAVLTVFATALQNRNSFMKISCGLVEPTRGREAGDEASFLRQMTLMTICHACRLALRRSTALAESPSGRSMSRTGSHPSRHGS